jgi:hypothetical protein
MGRFFLVSRYSLRLEWKKIMDLIRPRDETDGKSLC